MILLIFVSFYVDMFSVFLGIYLRNRIAGSRDNFIFNSLRNCQAFSAVDKPFQIPTNNVLGLRFLHIFVNTFYCPLDYPFSWVWGVFQCGFNNVEVFSCVYWLFIYLSWKTVYSDLLSLFKLGCLSFYHWIVNVLYNSVCSVLIRFDFQIFSPILRIVFSHYQWCLL